MSQSGNERGHFNSNKHAEWAGAMTAVPMAQGREKEKKTK